MLLCSCEGAKMMSAVVVAQNTRQPIPGAAIHVLNSLGDSTVTDGSGRFSLSTRLTGMMFGGPSFKFEVKKEGYETQVITTKYGADTIRLMAQ